MSGNCKSSRGLYVWVKRHWNNGSQLLSRPVHGGWQNLNQNTAYPSDEHLEGKNRSVIFNWENYISLHQALYIVVGVNWYIVPKIYYLSNHSDNNLFGTTIPIKVQAINGRWVCHSSKIDPIPDTQATRKTRTICKVEISILISLD